MFQFISVGWIIFIAFMMMLPPTIAALAAFRQTRIIHVLVNSNLDAVKTDLALAKAEIAMLKKHIGDQHDTIKDQHDTIKDQEDTK